MSSKVLALGLSVGCVMTALFIASGAGAATANRTVPGAIPGAGPLGGTPRASAAAAPAPAAPVSSGLTLGSGVVRDIRIEGTQRIEPATVRSYLTVQTGERFDADRIDQSLKALYATGLFADVTFRRDGDALVISVVENPIINRIAFEGNRRIETDALQKETQLRPRVVYTRTRVQNDVQRILDIYRRQGRFAATVDPKIIKLDQNRVDLVFEINEGARTGVRGIVFIGNEAYGEGELRSNVLTKETAWWRFLSSDDSYDPDRLNFDKDLLRRFYLKEGYADFRVISAVADLTPDKDAFIITFAIDEGERYRFGKVDVTTTLKAVDPQALRAEVTAESGDWYDAQAVEDTINKLNATVGDQQYAFVDVRPRITRNHDTHTIDVIYEVVEGPRVYVERIDINGNVRTMDKVVRRELLLSEGDAFNTSKLKRSEQRLKDLGYFSKVTVNPQDGSTPDRTIVNVDVTEQSTGEIALGAGYSTADGPLGDFSIRERNLLGRGQDLRFGATVAARRQEYDVSFTEPYFMDRDVSAGFDLFRISRNYQNEASFSQRNTGGALRLGFPLTEYLRQRVYYSATANTIYNVPTTASVYIQEDAGSTFTSLIGQELSYDRRNSRLNPTSGFFTRLTTDFAGVGGSTRFVRVKLGGAYYLPLFSENLVLSTSGETGYINGMGKTLHLQDYFFIGGDSLRGFKTAGIGPRDLATGDALGGKIYYRASFEASFPLGLPEDFGIKGHTFTDAGSLFNTDWAGQPGVTNDHLLRVSIGAGISWKSPFGPIRVDLAFPLVKESYDRKETFRFSFGTRF